MTTGSLFSDFLRELGVPHTAEYSDRRYAAMPFRSLFGLTNLMREYGVECEGVMIADKDELRVLAPPFLAQTRSGFVIVTDVAGDSVGYISEGQTERMPYDDFGRAWTGTAYLAFPAEGSVEPGYGSHRLTEIADAVKKWVLAGVILFLIMYLFISNGLYRHVSTVLIALLDLCGIALSVMLMQKSLNIGSAAADRVCAVLEKGGCDSVLKNRASKFFGIFSWSEVGLAYFGVSLIALLVFPQWTGYLALCNACCLPYTVWSIWYQRFRAKAWCTLCVSVQCTLWLLFFCYLCGGWLGHIFPLHIQIIVLGASYIAVLLAINRLSPMLDRNEHND